jgi:hypothetical protein
VADQGHAGAQFNLDVIYERWCAAGLCSCGELVSKGGLSGQRQRPKKSREHVLIEFPPMQKGASFNLEAVKKAD